MKKLNLWMMAAVLVCGLLATSCAKYDDPVTPPQEERKGDFNDFDLVPANAGDPAVVKALQSVANITDLKPFMNVYLGQCYYFNYLQPIDHNHPELGTYKQQVMLTYKDAEALTVLHTQGYALAGEHGKNHNRLDSIGFPAICLVPNITSDVPSTNIVQVEYRYHGFSLPEGEQDKFNYLNAKQQSADLHNIVTDLKKALLKGKWVSTGVSKNGMTTYEYAYYYPGDVDAYMPYAAPLMQELYDIRIGKYMFNESCKDYQTQIQAAFKKVLTDKTLYEGVKEEFLKYNIQKYGLANADTTQATLVQLMFGNLFSKESYGDIEAWSKYIPTEQSTAKDYLTFILLDENDERVNLKRNQRRASGENPFAVQIEVDQGNLCYDYSVILDCPLLQAGVKKSLEDYMNDPKNKQPVQLSLDVIEFLKTTTCPMFFVYGENDPWTGTAIPDPTNDNVKKMVVKNGTHTDSFLRMSPEEQNKLLQWMKDQKLF